MGRRHNEVATEEKMVPYKVVGGPEDYVKVQVDGQQLHAARDFRLYAAEAQGSGRGLFGPQGE